MIIYNPQTKKAKTMYVDELAKWLKSECDSIKFYTQIRNTEYPLSIVMYTKGTQSGERFAKMTASEVDGFNSILPPMKKDNTFNTSKFKV
jgi:hypothetical protein